jgi:predicted nuclease of restriction endonuclease-like (RecB) superfamily
MDDDYEEVRGGDTEASDYRDELQRERYETAIARERAEQAYLDHQVRTYEYQRRYQESNVNRAEQERSYDNRSNDISTINQAANTIANIARQAQVLSQGRGW